MLPICLPRFLAQFLGSFALGILCLLGANALALAQDHQPPTSCDPDNPAYQAAERAIAADAERDAAASIAAGIFKLRCPIDTHNGLMWYGCGIQCKLELYDLDKGDGNPVRGDLTASRWDICAAKFRDASLRYAAIYNGRLLADAKFPHKDICRKSAKQTAQGDDFYEYSESLDVLPRQEDAPDAIEDIATAARFGRLDDVKRLLAAGAEPNAPDQLGIAALEWAAARGYTEIADLLLAHQHGAKLPHTFKGYGHHYQLDPMRSAPRYGHVDILRKLVQAQYPASPLFDEDLMQEIGRGGHIEVLRYAIQDLNTVEKLKAKNNGFKAVEDAAHEAARRGHAAVLEALLDLGVSPDLLSWNFLGGKIDLSLLQTAIQESQVEAVRLLLRKGAQATADTLVYGTQWGNKDIIAALIEHGLDPNAKGHGAETYVSASQGTLPLISASVGCWNGHHKVLALTGHGADPNLADETGMTALHYAVKSGQMRDARVSTGLSQHIRQDMPDAVPENLECIEDLIKSGADVNVRDPLGNTPLHFAARSDYHVPTIKMLLDAGADINARDNAGRTPLDVATAGGLERVSKLLTGRGGRLARISQRR